MARRSTERVKGSDSALVDPEAGKKLEQAASAIGLSVRQLAVLVAASGALALPPAGSDGITFTLTLGELGKRMWGELQKVAAPERAAWFQELLEPQRIALVVTLLDQGYRPEVVSRELGVPAMQIREWQNGYADRIGAQVTQLRLSTIAGHVQLAAERAMAGLLEQGDYKGFFDVQQRFVKILQSLGIVDQAIHRVEVTHKHEDGTKAEIDAMIELEKKKQRRVQEIAMANGQQVDEVPTLEFEKEA